MAEYKLHLAELLLRLVTAILFLFQGYDKLFKIRIPGVIRTFKAESEQNHIPHFMLTFIVCFTSVTEFFGGLLLLFGLFTNYTLAFLGIDLILVTFAFSYAQAVWDMKHVFPRIVLVATLLLLPGDCQLFALDHFLDFK